MILEKYLSKDEIIQQYNNDYVSFINMIHKALGKDEEKIKLISHIAVWNLETIKGIKAVTKGEVPWFFNKKAVDEFNKKSEAKMKGSLQASLRKLKHNHQKLTNFLLSLPKDCFYKNFGKEWKGKKVTLFLICSYRHYLCHI